LCQGPPEAANSGRESSHRASFRKRQNRLAAPATTGHNPLA
jgi:hypothetical protein